jgi:hypothetical protein
MTRKLSISLPDDVAADLDEVENASAYVAEALRRYGRARRVRAFLAEEGHVVTDEAVARMSERLAALDRRRSERRLRAAREEVT